MSIKRVNRNTLTEWVDGLVSGGRVYGVRARGDRFVYGGLNAARELRLDFDTTLLPPRKYFQPRREVLMTFDRSTAAFESVLEEEPFVVFGVHPCDLAAIEQMDQVFSMDNFDKHYMARREAATLVGVDPLVPSANRFAAGMRHGAMDEPYGADVRLTRLEDGTTIVDPLTEKGDALCEALAGAPEADAAGLEERGRIWERNRAGALDGQSLRMAPEEIPGLLERGTGHAVWEEKARLCYSCGSCNLVCPTCYCFDVADELDWNLQTGRRVRTWDGCMLSEFARVAGGHNFRSKKAARYSHRYFRKGKYSMEQYGRIACVGCGRCVDACTADIANPAEIFNRLKEEDAP